MIQTKVEQLNDNEHTVHATLPQSEFDRVYSIRLDKIQNQAKMPGFRAGKTPLNVIKKQFGAKLFEETVSELLQTHYISAIESSGLTPAMQPELGLPQEQSNDDTFTFTLKVVTWPSVEIKDLSTLSFDKTNVNVEDSDIQEVVDRLLQSQVSYVVEDSRVAEDGDQVTIDFVGSIDGKAFEGGRGADHALVLGSGSFIPGFEEQLIGKKAGEHCTVNVTFPEDYQAAHLAGKSSQFDVDVKSVAIAEKAKDDDALAKMLSFDSADALRQDAQDRLSKEAEEATYKATRDAMFDAILKMHEINIPQALLDEDMRATTQRVLDNMKQQGLSDADTMANDPSFKKEVQQRSERGLKLSILLQAVRDLMDDIKIESDDIDAEIKILSEQYPEEQRSQFMDWIKGQKEQMSSIEDRLTEKKCVAYILEKSQPKTVSITLSEWQSTQDNTAA